MLACPSLGLAIRARPAGAQFPPDSFTNLQVLPDSIARDDLLATMRGFTFALGVNCQYCHGGENATPLDSLDFASDAERTKQIARRMLRMVAAVNGEHLSSIAGRSAPAVEVRCVTCHRGLARPVLIQDVLRFALAEGGAEAAVARYRSLRDQDEGRGSYDFSGETLREFGASLLRARRHDHALAILALSAELHPEAMASHFYLGEAYRASSDTARAIASYRKALEIDPSQSFIRELLDRLGARVP